MKKVFWRCNTNLFMKCGDKSFTAGKEYQDFDYDDGEISIRDDQGFMHHLGGWEAHFTRIERDTFEAAGKTWFRHTPGDPMPCRGGAFVDVLIDDETGTDIADKFSWDDCGPLSIIGWRYADAEASAPEPEVMAQKRSAKLAADFIATIGAQFYDNEEMQQADLAAMDDPGHLTPSQRRHIDAMEEKQAAKEKVQRDEEADKQREHSQALTDAANAMERVKQDHGHRLGWMQ